MKKRFLAVFLALALCVGLMPTVFAGGAYYLDDGGKIVFEISEGYTSMDIDVYAPESGYYSFTLPDNFSGSIMAYILTINVNEGTVIGEDINFSTFYDPDGRALYWLWLESGIQYTFKLWAYDETYCGEYNVSIKYWGNMTPAEKFQADGEKLYTIQANAQNGDVVVSGVAEENYVLNGIVGDWWTVGGTHLAWSGKTVEFYVQAPPGFKIDSVSVTDENGVIEIPWTEDELDDEYEYINRSMKTYLEGNLIMPATDIAIHAICVPLFSDLKSTAYYLEAVAWAVREGITTGTTPTTFSPNQDCTHAQILTFLWRTMWEPEIYHNPYTIDMTGNEFYYEAVRWATEQGMIDTEFKPNAPCTRADAVNYIWQAFGKTTASYDGRFTDVPRNSPYATAAAWAAEKGITIGTTATTFNPSGICNRGQIVTFLYRAYK